MASFRASSSMMLTYLFVSLVTSQNTFVNPPSFVKGSDYSQNDVWPSGSSQLLQWSTDFPSYNILLWQENLTESGAVAGTSIFAKTSTDPEPGGSNWVVQPYQFNLNHSNVFYLAVTPTANSTGGFESHYFNITQPLVMTSPTATHSSAASSTMAVATVTITSPATAGDNSKNSEALGLGLGLGIGIPSVLLLGSAIAYLVAYKRWKRKQARQTSLINSTSKLQQSKALEAPSLHDLVYEASAESRVYEAPLPELVYETSAEGSIQEAPSDNPVYEASPHSPRAIHKSQKVIGTSNDTSTQ